MLNMKKLLIMLTILLLPSLANGEFLLTHETRTGGSSITSDEYEILKKYDFVWLQKSHDDDQNSGDTFAGLRAANPDIIIYVYSHGHTCSDTSTADLTHPEWCTSVCRGGNYEYTLPYGKEANPGGDVFNDNPTYVLHSGASGCSTTGSKAKMSKYPEMYLLNWNCPAAVTYIQSAILHDFYTYPSTSSQKWHTADGLYFDNMMRQKDGFSNVPWTASEWDTYQDDFIAAMVTYLNTNASLEFGVNRGGSNQPGWPESWEVSDNHANPPSTVMEESAFVTWYGPSEPQFYSEAEWLRQSQVLRNTDNSKVIFQSMCDHSYNSSGTDNYGDTTYGYDALWYAMGSFLLSRNATRNNNYFSYNDGEDATWFDEFDAARGGNLDFGNDLDQLPVDDSLRTVTAGTTIYFREFANGYVYVNPTGTNSTTITLPMTCKEITKDALYATIDDLDDVTTFTLNRHRAKFFHKKSVAAAPDPPKNLRVVGGGA
jgi:hypothetical protein